MFSKLRKLSVIVLALFLAFPFLLPVEAAPLRQSDFKRVIADRVDETTIKLLKNKGCLIRHRLRDSASFECPEEIIPKLNVRESRIFHIMDLEADKQIGADKVWAEGITGTGVKVAVLDTGIDTDHPELEDSYLGGYDYVNNDPNPEDDHGHGTHVTGIITSNGINNANSKGVAPETGIYMYKVCNSNGSCYEDDMVAAMEAAVATDARVMSISVGGGSYTTQNCDGDSLAAKVNWVVNQGLTVAVAAGNDGRGVSSPGCASGVIGVGAVDKSNNVPYWSGRSLALDIVAPGVNNYSTYLNGGYQSMSGTSMATPHVSGVTALLLETDPTLTTNEVKTALYDTASPVNKCYSCRFFWGGYCYGQREVSCNPEITGAGVVNAYEAYLAVKPVGPECTADVDCDDSLYCNGGETCVDGVCQSGTPIDCSPLSDQCHQGVCDENLNQCVAEPKAKGTSCDDGEFCTKDDYCSEGSCVSGSQRTCDDKEECTADSCDETNDACVNEPVSDNTSCTSGLCCSGTCGSPICSADSGCDDGNTCTIDACHYSGTCAASCSHEELTACFNDDGCCPTGCDYLTDNDCAAAVKCWSGEYNYLTRNRNQFKKFCKCTEGNYDYQSYSTTRGRQTAFQYLNTGNNENWETKSTSTFYPAHQVKCSDGNWYPTNQDYYFD